MNKMGIQWTLVLVLSLVVVGGLSGVMWVMAQDGSATVSAQEIVLEACDSTSEKDYDLAMVLSDRTDDGETRKYAEYSFRVSGDDHYVRVDFEDGQDSGEHIVVDGKVYIRLKGQDEWFHMVGFKAYNLTPHPLGNGAGDLCPELGAVARVNEDEDVEGANADRYLFEEELHGGFTTVDGEEVELPNMGTRTWTIWVNDDGQIVKTHTLHSDGDREYEWTTLVSNVGELNAISAPATFTVVQ